MEWQLPFIYIDWLMFDHIRELHIFVVLRLNLNKRCFLERIVGLWLIIHPRFPMVCRMHLSSQKPIKTIYILTCITWHGYVIYCQAHLTFEASICLLECPPSPDALCDLLLAQLRGDAHDLGPAEASAWARLAAVVYHYQPPRLWGSWRHHVWAIGLRWF